MPKVVTEKVRFSYLHVFEAHAPEEGQKPAYSVCVLVDKRDRKTLIALEKAVEAAKKEGEYTKFEGKIPKNLKLPLRDGDIEKEDDPNFEGKVFFNAKTYNRPGIVDANLQTIIDPEELYSGCYGKVSVNIYPYNYNGKKGIAVGLNNLLKLEDGERLSGGAASPEADFGKVDDDDLV